MLKQLLIPSFLDVRRLFLNNGFLFILIASLSYLVAYIGDISVFTERFYIGLLTEAKYPPDEIARIKEFNTQMGWVFDLFEPITLLIKFSVIAVCLFAVAYLKDIKLSFEDIFRAVILAEVVFIVAAVIRIIWLGIHAQDIDLIYYRTFSPLALVNIFSDLVGKYPFLIMPMRSLSLFQIMYVFVLVYLMGKSCDLKLSQSWRIVVISYFFLYTLYVGVLVSIGLINLN